MAFDPSIVMGYRGLGELPNPMNQLAQVSQIQAAQRQGELSQMQFEDLKNDRAEMQKFQAELAAKGGSPDLGQYADMLLKSGNSAHQKMGIELKQKLVQQAQFANIMGSQPTVAPVGPVGSAAAPVGPVGPAAAPVGPVGPAAAPVNALAPTNAAPEVSPVNALAPNPLAANVDALRQKRDLLLGMGTTQSIAAAKALDADIALASKEAIYHTVPGVGLVDPRTGRVITPSVESTNPEIKQYEYAKKQGYPGSLFDFKRDMAIAGRAPAQPRAEQPPVAVIDPATGQAIYVSREEALRNKMQPAANAPALKPLTEGQTIKLRTDVGKDYKAASTALSQIDDLLISANAVKTSPGLSAATGYTGKYLPSFSEGAAAQAETRLANLRGKVTALGKATASMGGAIGSIATQEWKVLADQIAVLDETKGKKPLLDQIALLEEQARGAAARIRDTYEKTRAEDFERFPQFRDLPAPKAAGAAPAAGTGGFKYLGKEGAP
jgi:hypothetical protein